jgi:hypothetical protein
MRSAGVLARPTSLGRSMAVPGKSTSVLQVAVVEEALEEAPQPTPLARPAMHAKAPAKPAAQPQRQAHAHGKQHEGTVAKVASGAGTVQVQFPRGANPQVGGRVKVYHRFLLNESCIGDLEIVALGDAAVTARPVDGCNLSKLAAGDRAVLSAAGQSMVQGRATFESAEATDRN